MAMYASADWHGHTWIWDRVRNILQPDDTLFFLGDAADRGPDGWFLIKTLLNDARVFYIKGNHDQMLCDRYFRNNSYEVENIHNYNGGSSTWRQFLADRDPLKVEFINKLDHCGYFATYINKNHQSIFMSHSGSVNMYDNESLIWDRDHFNDSYTAHYDLIVHGHTPIPYVTGELYNEFDEDVNAPLFYCNNKKCDIDAGAHFTNTAILLNLDTLESEILKR